jgi:hypothetical protein
LIFWAEAEGNPDLLENKVSLLFSLGALHEELGNRDEAAAWFREVIELTAGRNLGLYVASMEFDGGILRDNVFKLAVDGLNGLK